MVKLIGLLKKKAGMSTMDFRAYYETKHAPFIVRTLPVGNDYRRNYANLVRVEGKEVEGEPEFDVVTEMWFADQAAYQAFAGAMQDEAIRAAVVADEERFLDRSATCIMLVEEHRSPIA